MAETTAKKAKTAAASAYTPRLKKTYLDEFAPELMKELGIKNISDVPKIDKITVNVGLGRAKDDKKLLEVAANTFSNYFTRRNYLGS